MKYTERMLLSFTLLMILQKIHLSAYICGLIAMFIGMYFDHREDKEIKKSLEELSNEKLSVSLEEKNVRRNFN